MTGALETILLGLVTCAIWAGFGSITQHIKKQQTVTYTL